MQFLLIGFYLLLCFTVALIGRDTRIGFWPTLILSVVFTPVIMLIVVLIAERVGRNRPA